MNKVMLYGNVGKAPKFNTTGQGTPQAKFSIAPKEISKKGQNPELTGFNVSPTEKQPSLFEIMLDKEIQLLSKTESLKP